MRKGGVYLFIFIAVFGILVSGIVLAQSENDTLIDTTDTATDAVTDIGIDGTNATVDEGQGDVATGTESEKVLGGLEEEYAGEKITNPGLTPDSAFYFVDEFFDRFGNEIDNREERIAEVKAMIEKGDYQAAKKALDRYNENAKELEKNVDPDKRDEARRSAAVIRRALNEVKDEIPKEERKEFYDDIIEKESSIVTAVEISSKIKDLCVQLAELDPMEYSRICKTGDDAPEWKKKLHKTLTAEQEKEAREFGDIMSECFKTSGNDCRCEDISFYDFSVACSKVAPLAVKCDAGSEDACDMMDEIEMPELPPHLQEIFDDIEMKYGEARYDMHMPPECIKEGASTPKECMLIMVRVHAPFECKDAIKKAIESGEIKDERGARDICDRIMMPPECEGMSPDECARNMMPPECVEKDLSPRECKKFMDSSMKPGMGPGPGFGQDCGGIQDSMKRLECYDNMGKDMGEQYGVGPGFKAPEGEITWQCKENRIHWPPDCEKFMREEWPEQERRNDEERRKNEERWNQDEEKWKKEYKGDKPWERGSPEGDDFRGGPGPGCDDCASQCPGASRTDCINDQCKCYYEDEGQQYGSGEGPGPGEPSDYYGEPPEGSQQTPPSEGDGGYEGPTDVYTQGGEDTTTSSSGGGVAAPSDSGTSNSGGGESSSGDGGGITGEVIAISFWNHYIGKSRNNFL